MAKMRTGRNGGKLKTGGNNGGGRPPKLPQLDKLLADVLGKEDGDGITAAQKILASLYTKATSDDKDAVRAAEVLLKRAYGEAKQSIEMSGPNGGPIHTVKFVVQQGDADAD